MKRKNEHIIAWVPRTLLGIFTLFTFFYAYLPFYQYADNFFTFEDFLFYFLPTILLLILIRVGWRHEYFEGIALILLSFIFLGFYHVRLGLISFAVLIVTGTLCIIDSKKFVHRHKRSIV